MMQNVRAQKPAKFKFALMRIPSINRIKMKKKKMTLMGHPLKMQNK